MDGALKSMLTFVLHNGNKVNLFIQYNIPHFTSFSIFFYYSSELCRFVASFLLFLISLLLFNSHYPLIYGLIFGLGYHSMVHSIKNNPLRLSICFSRGLVHECERLEVRLIVCNYSFFFRFQVVFRSLVLVIGGKKRRRKREEEEEKRRDWRERVEKRKRRDKIRVDRAKERRDHRRKRTNHMLLQKCFSDNEDNKRFNFIACLNFFFHY